MSGDRFPNCLPIILENEGAFSWDPNDHGGATMEGITLQTFQDYYGADKTVDDLRKMTDAQRDAIYRGGYFDAANCDLMPVGVDLVCFDISVNSNPHMAITMLQRACKASVDGKWGPKTYNAMKIMAPLVIISRLTAIRVEYYDDLVAADADQHVFLNGWRSRVSHVADIATAMAVA